MKQLDFLNKNRNFVYNSKIIEKWREVSLQFLVYYENFYYFVNKCNLMQFSDTCIISKKIIHCISFDKQIIHHIIDGYS